MQILEKIEDLVTLSATQQELAGLGKIIMWVQDSLREMDPGKVLLEEDEINEVLDSWDDFLHQADRPDEASV